MREHKQAEDMVLGASWNNQCICPHFLRLDAPHDPLL